MKVSIAEEEGPCECRVVIIWNGSLQEVVLWNEKDVT
jgi:hypothetical protein